MLNLDQLNYCREKIHLYLKKNHFKITKQRDLIIKCLFAHKKHLSIEDIYNIVRKQDPSLGIATVYRCMRILKKGSFVTSINTADNNVLYEVSFDSNHDHIQCLSCDKVIEFTSDKIKQEHERLAREHRFALSYYRHEIFGYCDDCCNLLQ